MPGISTDPSPITALTTMYNSYRLELFEAKQTPLLWGAIMLPLSAIFLVAAITPSSPIPIIFGFISIALIILWGYVCYYSNQKIHELQVHIKALEEHIMNFGHISHINDIDFIKLTPPNKNIYIFAVIYIILVVIIMMKFFGYEFCFTQLNNLSQKI